MRPLNPAWLGCLAALMAGGLCVAQVVEGPVRGFQRADVDPATGKRKSLLSGGTMEQVSPKELRISDGVRVEVYDPDGSTNLVVTTPGCFYNLETRSVHSPGALRFSTGNGQFELEGEGFTLTAQGGQLTISNRVQAMLAKRIFGGAGGTNVSTAGIAGSAGSDSTNLVRVYSDRFQSSTNLAVFRENVRVEDGEGRMRCRQLSLNLGGAGRQIDRIVAEEQVEYESGELRARSERADYRLAEETVYLTGKPSWQMGQRSGSAESATLRRREQELVATGSVRVRLPASELGREEGFLGLRRGGADEGGEGVAVREVEVFADRCRFWTDPAVTNVVRGLFEPDVRVVTGRGTLRCAQLGLVGVGRPVRAEEMVAEGGVVLEEGVDRLEGSRLRYTATNQWVEVTGDPRWRIRGSEGTARRLTFDLAAQSYVAREEVRMTVPGAAMSGSLGALPRFVQRTNRVEAPARPAGEVRPITFASEELEFVSGARERRGDRVEYRGGVRVHDGQQTTLTSDRLTAVTVPGTNVVESLVAEGGVEVEMVVPEGVRLARGERLEYRGVSQELELTGREGVELVAREQAGGAAGESRARGTRLVYRALPDLLVLEGRPQVTTPRGTAEGDLIQVDRGRTTVLATGNWRFRVRAETFGKVPVLPATPQLFK